jgi:hypothetical protein
MHEIQGLLAHKHIPQHFLRNITGPYSSYSDELSMHMLRNVLSSDSIEPPCHAAYLGSDEAATSYGIVTGADEPAKTVASSKPCFSLFVKPGMSVVPPT